MKEASATATSPAGGASGPAKTGRPTSPGLLLSRAVRLATALLLSAAVLGLPAGFGRPQPVALADSAAEPDSSSQPDTLTMGVAPARTMLDLQAGQTVTFEATCIARGNVNCRATVDTRDALRRSAGFQFQPPGDELWSAGRWLSVEPAEFDLDPGDVRTMKVTVTVPEGTPDGEYYAAFFVTARPVATPGAGTVIRAAGSIGSIVYIAIGEHLGRSAILVPYDRLPRPSWDKGAFWRSLGALAQYWWRCLVVDDRNVTLVAEGQPLKVFLPLENNEQGHVQPRAAVSFYRGETLLRRVEQEGDVIIPGGTKLVEVVWADSPLYGRLRAEVEIEYGGPDLIRVSRTFLALPVKAILGLFALAFGFGYLTARRGRGKAHRAQPPAAPQPPASA